MATLTINATEFKAKCLAILDDVEATGNTVTVTKRGRPVATIVPAKTKKFKSLKGCLEGIVVIPEDLLEENRANMWEAMRSKFK
jgi:prevent-host-death family protein